MKEKVTASERRSTYSLDLHMRRSTGCCSISEEGRAALLMTRPAELRHRKYYTQEGEVPAVLLIKLALSEGLMLI